MWKLIAGLTLLVALVVRSQLDTTSIDGSLARAPNPPAIDTIPETEGSGIDTGTPLVEQRCDKWCWAASAEMVAKQHDKDIDQCEIVSNRLGANCCRRDACQTACNQLSGFPAQINRAFSKSGLHGYQIDGPLSLADLVANLDARLPVMLAATDLANGHFVVVVGYTKAASGYSFQVNDPWPNAGTVSRSYPQLLTYGGNPWLFTWIVKDE
jgi:hypothetical protein